MSNSQELCDRNGTLLGRISQTSSGIYEGRDKNGKLKGTYDPKTNKTFKAGGTLVGKGNMLSNLILAP